MSHELDPEREYSRLAWGRTRAQRVVAETPWWQWRRTRDAVADLRELQAEDGLDEAAARLAHHLLARYVPREWAAIAPGRNPWHPDMLEHMPALARRAAAEARHAQIPNAFLLEGQPATWGEDSRIAELLTADAAEQLARDTATRLQEVRDDPTIFVLYTTTPDGDPMLVLQHGASGLRGRFARDAIDGFGDVFSKPYDIASIDPSRPHDDGSQWQLYAGLGIGRRLYLAAAGIYPDVRWRGGIQSSYAAALRSRLHGADPHRWAAECVWCDAHGIRWQTATPGDFSRHPVTPAPADIAARLIEVDTRFA